MTDSSDDGLSVRPGAPETPNVNPDLRRPPVDRPDAGNLFRQLREGDPGALARGITLVESTLDDDRRVALELLDLCQAHSGTAIRVGLSGPPGAGKSTLIDVLGMHLVESGSRVAILAVDPTSERTGGSILGDKTRMASLAQQTAAYIRPTPAGAARGGVAHNTRSAITVVEAAGYDVVIVETIGVGQSETAVRHMVDTLVLLNLAGAGDELQGIKRGIVEAADIVAVSKADGSNREAALAARRELRQALQLLPPDDTNWKAPVLAVSARDPATVTDLWNAVEIHREHLEGRGALDSRRRAQSVRWLRDELTDRLLERLKRDPRFPEALDRLEAQVASRERHPHRAADDLLQLFVPAGS